MLLGLFQKFPWGMGAACVAGYDHYIKHWMVQKTNFYTHTSYARNQCVRGGGGGVYDYRSNQTFDVRGKNTPTPGHIFVASHPRTIFETALNTVQLIYCSVNIVNM